MNLLEVNDIKALVQDDTCLVDDTSSQMGFVDAVAQNLESTKEDPEAMLGLLIPADEDVRKLCSSFNVDHCGLFLACRDAGDMTGQSEEGGYSVMQRFPSAIVAKSLTKQYKRPVGIEIVKMERGDSKLELFLVQSGLSTDELAHECSTRSHLALMPRTSDASALTTFVDIMVRLDKIIAVNLLEIFITQKGRAGLCLETSPWSSDQNSQKNSLAGSCKAHLRRERHKSPWAGKDARGQRRPGYDSTVLPNSWKLVWVWQPGALCSWCSSWAPWACNWKIQGRRLWCLAQFFSEQPELNMFLITVSWQLLQALCTEQRSQPQKSF